MKLVALLLVSSLAVLEAGKLHKLYSDPPCRPNEVLKEHYCHPVCEKGTCKDYERHYGQEHVECIAKMECFESRFTCICEPGYLRNSKGICHHCYGACQAFTCSDYEKLYGHEQVPCILILICSSKPYNCICKPGYLRKGDCIPASECEFLKGLVAFLLLSSLAVLEARKIQKFYPGPPCRPNEVLKEHYCYGACEQVTCKDYEWQYGKKYILCILMLRCSESRYNCVCKPGYLRNSKGICVPRYKCEFLNPIPL
nr:unnamed protein product [Callosobruchus analis]